MCGQAHQAHRCISILVPKIIGAGGNVCWKFSIAKSSDPTKQMAVHRAYEKATSGKGNIPPPNQINVLTVGMSTKQQPTNKGISKSGLWCGGYSNGSSNDGNAMAQRQLNGDCDGR